MLRSHHAVTARLGTPASSTNRGRRRSAGLLLIALIGVTLSWPASVAAVDNVPPIAVDDPGTDCQSPDDFGGSFPIPEDWGQFAFVGSCSAIANDTDGDGSIVAWQIVTPPSHGALEYFGANPEAFGYTPEPDFSTPAGDWVSDSFTYQAIDDGGAVSNEATMRFWIAPINDAPTFLSVPTVEVAKNSGPYDESWLSYVSAGPANESDQAIAFIITDVESHGVVDLFSVPPEFTPDGNLTFEPGPDEHGYADVTVFLQDDGGLEDYMIGNLPQPPDDTSDPVTFRIVVNEGNRGPAAVDDEAEVYEDSSENIIDVLANDTDADGDALTVTETTDGALGTVAPTEDGTAVAYTPNENANGLDSFTYTITDGNGESATANVAVTIAPLDDSPDAIDDGFPTPIKIGRGAGPVPIAVLANDSDPDATGLLRITSVTQGSYGTVAIAADGFTLTYDPAGLTTGIDVFTYTIDNGYSTDTATVQVVVAKDTTAPITSAPVVVPGGPTPTGMVPLDVSWTAEDPESAIASSQLQIRRDGGSWSPVALSYPTALQATVLVPAGHTCEFRVRATNGATPSVTGPFKVSIPVSV
jgi:hypothetical protein